MILKKYIPIWNALVYGDKEYIASIWKDLSANEHQEFLKRCSLEGGLAFAGAHLFQAGCREELDDVKNIIMAGRLQTMRQEAKLKQFCKQLEEKKIRYALLKGTDLAYRVYKDSSWRPFGDWDILFHYDDMDRAIQFIKDEQWIPLSPWPDNTPDHFHFPLCTKDKIALEPHWTLPMFDGCTPQEIWQFIRPISDDSSRYILEPELNLLLLTRHASEGYYRTMAVTKLLLDAATIISQEKVDWGKMHQVAEVLHQPYPGDLLAAFADFFPSELIREMGGQPERAKCFRELFENRDIIGVQNNEDWLMSSSDKLSAKWIRARWRNLSFRSVRHKYSLPERGCWGKVFWLTSVEFVNKCFRCIKYLFCSNEKVNHQQNLIQRAEGRKAKDN